MKWNTLKKLHPEQFKRLVGVPPATFEKMVAESKRISQLQTKKVKGKKRGPKEKLNWRDKVLMLLMNYREYRTFAHIAVSHDISEAPCCRIITTLEKWLIKSDVKWEVVVVDVCEHPIERPKKTAAVLFREKEEAFPKKSVSNR